MPGHIVAMSITAADTGIVAIAGTIGAIEELTELLLDSSDDLTAAQIVAIRRRITDFAVARGWVLD